MCAYVFQTSNTRLHRLSALCWIAFFFNFEWDPNSNQAFMTLEEHDSSFMLEQIWSISTWCVRRLTSFHQLIHWSVMIVDVRPIYPQVQSSPFVYGLLVFLSRSCHHNDVVMLLESMPCFPKQKILECKSCFFRQLCLGYQICPCIESQPHSWWKHAEKYIL